MFLSLLILDVGMRMAVVAPFTMLVAPAVFMVLERRFGARAALLCVCFGSAVIFMAADPLLAVLYMTALGILGVSFGQLAGRSKSGAEFLLAAITTSVAVKVLMLLLFFAATGISLFYISPEASESMAVEIAKIFSDSALGFSNAAAQSYVRSVVNSMSMQMPAMLIIFSAFDTFVSYLVTLRVIKKFGGSKMVSLPPFGLWKFPRNVFFAFLVAVIADTASRIFPDNFTFEMIAVNILELLRGLFFLEGLALCWYYMTALGVNKILKTAVTTFCVVFWPVSFILSSVGFFDIWFDLRRHFRRK